MVSRVGAFLTVCLGIPHIVVDQHCCSNQAIMENNCPCIFRFRRTGKLSIFSEGPTPICIPKTVLDPTSPVPVVAASCAWRRSHVWC